MPTPETGDFHGKRCSHRGCGGPVTNVRGAVIDCGSGDLVACPYAPTEGDGLEPDGRGPAVALDAPSPQVPVAGL